MLLPPRPVQYLVYVLALVAPAGCTRPQAPLGDQSKVQIEGAVLSVSGPYTHQNLAVFLIHAEEQDPQSFITLDEGLNAGIVKVNEGAEGRVDMLEIENQSDYPLFLHEGDRLQGGKQDRTIHASLVVPAHSGKMPLPAFCIEQSRWAHGANGDAFKNVSNHALAPKLVRAASKIHDSQMDVWAAVRAQKVQLATRMLADNTNSSLNEALDAPKVKQISDEFAKAIGSILVANPNAVGVAIVVNGKIEELNIYPNHGLLAKLFPRLLQSYALQATLEKEENPAAVTANDVVVFMTHGARKASKTHDVDAGNRLCTTELDNKMVECRTSYQGATVHLQRLSDTALTGRLNTETGFSLENDDIGLDPSVRPNYSVDRIEEVTVPRPAIPGEKKEQPAKAKSPNPK